MKSSIDDSRQSLGLFSKDWNVFKSNFTNARKSSIEHPIYEDQTIALNGGGFKSGISSIFRSKDLNGLKEYNRYVEAGLHPMKAYSLSMKGCSEEARKNAVAMAKGKMTYEEATKSIKSMGSASKAASIGMKALSIAGNMLATMAVIKGVELLATAISDYVNAAKIARENTEALSSSLTQSQNKYAEDSKKIEELSSRYETLSKGVNNLGQNVSLSSSQYDEYKSIIKQLSDIMPDLTLRFNEQGEAIGFVSGKLDDANEKYHEYQRNQAEKFLQEGDSEGHTYQDALDNLNNVLSDDAEWYTEIFASLGINSEDALSTKEKIKYLNSVVKSVEDNPSISDAKNQLVKSIEDIKLSQGWSQDAETKGKLALLGSDDLSHMNDDEFGEYIENLHQKIGLLQKEYEYSATVIRQCMTQVAASKNEYWDDSLGDDGREKVVAFLSGITTDFLENNNLITKESQGSFVDDLINSITENKDGISDAFGSLFTLNIEDMNVDDARMKIQEFCTIIANVLEKSLPEVQKILGYDNFFKTASNYDRTVAYASGGNYKSAKNVNDSKGFDQKEVLATMDKYSINTDEEIDKFKAILDTAESLEDAIKSYVGVSTEATKTTLSFSEAWKAIGTSGNEKADKKAKEAKEALLELAKAGKLTEEAFSKSTIAENFLKDTKLSAEDATQKINELISSADQLASMKTGISSISTILGEKKENQSSKKTRTKGIGADTLAGMPEDIKAQTKEYEHFVEVLGDGTSSMDECMDAANKLATAYVTSGNFLANLTDENKDYYISILKEMNVENAESIVTKTVTANKEKLKYETQATEAAIKDMADQTSNASKEFVEEAQMTSLAKAELADLVAKEKIFASTELSTSDKVNELNKLAEAYFGVSNAIQISSAMGSDSRYWNNPEDYEKSIQDKWNKLVKKNARVAVGNVIVKPDTSKNSKSKKDKKDKKSKSTQQFDWINRALDRLSSKLDLVKAKYDNLFNGKKANSDSLLKQQNKNLDKQYKLLQKTEKYQEKAQKKYAKKADSIKLDASLKKAVREGRIKGSMKQLIATYGEKKADKIQKYQDWYSIMPLCLAISIENSI